MTAILRPVLKCDIADCGVELIARRRTIKAARVDAKAQGWTYIRCRRDWSGVGWHDRCPKHSPPQPKP